MLKRGLKHLSRVSDVLFRTLRIERDITIFPDDVFLTSFPAPATPGPDSWLVTLSTRTIQSLSSTWSDWSPTCISIPTGRCEI